MQCAVLRQQLTHVLCTAARGCLVGLCAHPLHQAGLVQSANAHQHAADRAVAAYPVGVAIAKRVFDDGHVDWV